MRRGRGGCGGAQVARLPRTLVARHADALAALIEQEARGVLLATRSTRSGSEGGSRHARAGLRQRRDALDGKTGRCHAAPYGGKLEVERISRSKTRC